MGPGLIPWLPPGPVLSPLESAALTPLSLLDSSWAFPGSALSDPGGFSIIHKFSHTLNVDSGQGQLCYQEVHVESTPLYLLNSVFVARPEAAGVLLGAPSYSSPSLWFPGSISHTLIP